MNQSLSLTTLLHFLGRLLFCGACAMTLWIILGIIGFPISQDIARIAGLFIGWSLYPRIFNSKPHAQPTRDPISARDLNP
ncbi:MAG: hypothetical protein HC933_07395 [Pleurocapsa sp. SU_196_0]|nr:hypothetical protein [Pleurocapsa sp. SU_196_0]